MYPNRFGDIEDKTLIISIQNSRYVWRKAPLRQFSMLGLPVHIHESYRDWLAQRLQNHQGTHVVTINAEMTMQARKNPELANVIQQAELVVPDGSGIVLYLRSSTPHLKAIALTILYW